MQNIIIAIANRTARFTPAAPVAAAPAAVVLYEDHVEEMYGDLNKMDQRLTKFYFGDIFETIANYKSGDCLEYAKHSRGVNWCEEQQRVWLQTNPASRSCSSAPTVQEAVREMWDPASICASL